MENNNLQQIGIELFEFLTGGDISATPIDIYNEMVKADHEDYYLEGGNIKDFIEKLCESLYETEYIGR